MSRILETKAWVGNFSRLRVGRSRLIVWLELATLVYIALPVMIWVLGWLARPLAAVLALGLVVGLALAWKETRAYFRLAPSGADGEPVSLPVWPLVGAAAVALIWGVYSGAGGFTYHNLDWLKHFAILKDLITAPWPVVYAIEGKGMPLVYYLAYYLPAASVGSVFGWGWACFTLLVWTCLGTVIACGWFVILVGEKPFLAAVYFIFANGLDFIGERLVTGDPIPSGIGHIDWWAGWTLVNFPGHYSQLVWAPQHSLATWSVTGLLAVQISAGRNLGHAGLVAALAGFWSPFSVLGMVPLAIYAVVKEKGRGLVSFANLVALPLLVVNVVFLLAQTTPLPQGLVMHDVRESWPRFLIFHVMEWGLFALFACELRRSRNPGLRGFFWTALAGLALIPCYRLGFFNDWCMRVSIPSMFLLWAGVGRSLLHAPFTLESRLLLVMCFFGAMGALYESSRSWFSWRSDPPTIEQHDHIPHIGEDFARQYLGSEDTFFFRHLARSYVPWELPPPKE